MRCGSCFPGTRTRVGNLPFPILGPDSDNGTEFINHVLVDYCASRGITFTRSRPYLKNDTCHIEQIPLCQIGLGAADQQACH